MIWADERNQVPTLEEFLTNQSVIVANELPIGPNRCCVGYVADKTPRNIEGYIVEDIAFLKLPMAAVLKFNIFFDKTFGNMLQATNSS